MTRTRWSATGTRPWPNWAPRLRAAKALPRQVRDSIAALVAEDMRPGDPLPSEMAVAERLMVSRSTVREAMKLLEQEGLVETRRGTGRFATALSGLRPERPMTKFESITKMMTELGYEVSTKVVGVTRAGRDARASSWPLT